MSGIIKNQGSQWLPKRKEFRITADLGVTILIYRPAKDTRQKKN